MRANPRPAFALFARKIAYTFNQTDLALNYSYAYFTKDVASPQSFFRSSLKDFDKRTDRRRARTAVLAWVSP